MFGPGHWPTGNGRSPWTRQSRSSNGRTSGARRSAQGRLYLFRPRGTNGRNRLGFRMPAEFATDSPLEGTGFEPSVPPRKRRPSREAPRPTIVASQDDLCLMTPSNLSVRHLSSATAESPFTRAGPMVRIRFPPAVSRQTIGSSAAEPHLPFVMSRHPCMPELRATMRKGGTSLSATPEGSATAQE